MPAPHSARCGCPDSAADLGGGQDCASRRRSAPSGFGTGRGAPSGPSRRPQRRCPFRPAREGAPIRAPHLSCRVGFERGDPVPSGAFWLRIFRAKPFVPAVLAVARAWCLLSVFLSLGGVACRFGVGAASRGSREQHHKTHRLCRQPRVVKCECLHDRQRFA